MNHISRTVYFESVPGEAFSLCNVSATLEGKVDTLNVARQKIQNDKLSGVKVIPQPTALFCFGGWCKNTFVCSRLVAV